MPERLLGNSVALRLSQAHLKAFPPSTTMTSVQASGSMARSCQAFRGFIDSLGS